MDKFEMMLNELFHEDREQTGTNVLGSKIGERREVTIRYAVGKEEYPEIIYGEGVDPAQRKEDAVAMLYAAGKIFEEFTGAPKMRIRDELVQAATNSLKKQLLREAFEDLMEDLKDE